MYVCRFAVRAEGGGGLDQHNYLSDQLKSGVPPQHMIVSLCLEAKLAILSSRGDAPCFFARLYASFSVESPSCRVWQHHDVITVLAGCDPRLPPLPQDPGNRIQGGTAGPDAHLQAGLQPRHNLHASNVTAGVPARTHPGWHLWH